MIKSVGDYYQINESLATSGQPTPEEFSLISQAGYQIVINLATSSSTHALANEGEIVTDLGMIYIHIPVLWDNPRLKDVIIFFKVMQAFEEHKIWVHCAKNMRVSCFIYLWQKYILHLTEEQAKYPMSQIWQPTGVWQKLIEQGEIHLTEPFKI
ncbi:MAG: protein tyrosine phosphatase family protein [Cyanobacteria bacterium P01_A01_bin.40]